jgi:DNA-binding LacI/PurR family transcriptional regulator
MSVVKIAKRAGVSIATVSRVMSNSRRVQPELAQKVRTAIEELGIAPRQPRLRERRLASGGKAASTIGIITIGMEYRQYFTDPVIAAVVAELTRAAGEQHVGMLLAEMPDPNVLSRVVEQGQIDGALVLIPSGVDASAADKLARHVPVVRLMGAHIGPIDQDQITSDSSSIGFLAAKYLIEKGCKQLAFMTLTPEWTMCRLRGQGFVAACDGRGLQGRAQARAYFNASGHLLDHSYGPNAVSGPSWDAVMKQFHSDRPDGLFVARDSELLEVYRMLAASGIKPGSDIQVISCDHCEAWLRQLEPRPVSIDINLPDTANAAVARLISRIAHPDQPILRCLINPKLPGVA